MTGTTQAPTPQRPMTLSADRRKLSYRSKSGRVLTLQLTNSNAAANSLRQLEKKYNKDDKPDKSDPTLTVTMAGKEDSQGLWPQLFDTLSLYVEEAIEVACFGPYDEAAV